MIWYTKIVEPKVFQKLMICHLNFWNIRNWLLQKLSMEISCKVQITNNPTDYRIIVVKIVMLLYVVIISYSFSSISYKVFLELICYQTYFWINLNYEGFYIQSNLHSTGLIMTKKIVKHYKIQSDLKKSQLFFSIHILSRLKRW